MRQEMQENAVNTLCKTENLRLLSVIWVFIVELW